MLYYLGQVKNIGVWVFSILFPIHEGLTIERYNELDVYYDPHYVPLDDEHLWISSVVSVENDAMAKRAHNTRFDNGIPQMVTGTRKEKKK